MLREPFSSKETKSTPFRFNFEAQDRDYYERMLTQTYGNEGWKTLVKPNVVGLTGISYFLNLESVADGLEVDALRAR